MRIEKKLEILAEFKEIFGPNAWVRLGHEFYGEDEDSGSVLWSGEGACDYDGSELFEYYIEDRHVVLDAFCEKHGIFFEFLDPGTVIAYKK